MSLPLIMLKSGPQPQSVTDLNAQIISLAAQLNPGLTANLPGSLIEDIASTDTAALSLIDQAQVELLNSITPYGANLFLLNQLGQIYGVTQGTASNTSVYVVFVGPVGFLIPQGFVVSDGTYQYVVQDNSIITSSGSSSPVYCVANVPGVWAVPANTVVFTSTSIPAAITITCNNPLPGTPSSGEESPATYRARVLGAGLVTSSGTPDMIKTLLTGINGVNPQLISVQRNNYYGQWEVIVGGGDPYAVANAIYIGCGDVNVLCGSAMVIESITNANPGVVTTNLYHGFNTGQVIQIKNATGMTGINNVNLTITNISLTTFSIGIDTTSSGTYVSGSGIVTPNNRNQVVSINSIPDTYTIPFVIPIQQTPGVVVTWNTFASNLTANTTVSALATPVVIAYVNSLEIGQPLNIIELQTIVAESLTAVIPTEQLITLTFAVTINGQSVSPTFGTQAIYGDPEGYYYMTSANITFSKVV